MTTPSLQDLSETGKTGLKGPNAAEWLASQGIEIPSKPNTCAFLPDGSMIARLAETEFFVDGRAAAKLASALDNASLGVYPVPHEDACFSLSGPRLHEVLLQVCSVDFQADRAANTLYMTSIAGVPVLAIPEKRDAAPSIRIWADPTFGPYLWHTLSTIVEELKGEPQ